MQITITTPTPISPTMSPDQRREIIQEFFPDLHQHEAIYKDLHQHPDLPCQELRTAAVIADRLKSLGFDVQQAIGGHGVIGILHNGSGPKVLLRAELDALPIKEKTGLAYASKVEQVDSDGCRKHVMHGCAHDMHMTCLLAVAALLHAAKATWSGVLICLFQPNEERLLGAQAMVDDGLFAKIPLADVCLAQHCVPTKSGTIAVKPGRILGLLDSLEVRVYGRGTHSATPQLGVDPIVLASSIVARLQTIVSREMNPQDPVVISCGSFHGGTDASIIPEYVDIKVDVRTFSEAVQKRAVAAVKRIISKECEVSGAPIPPRIITACSCPAIDNDEQSTELFTKVLKTYYGKKASDVIQVMTPDIVADDFSILAKPPGKKEIPYIYWNIGVTDPKVWDKASKEDKLRELPCNHNPTFAPAIEPTLRTGIEALALSALTFLELS